MFWICSIFLHFCQLQLVAYCDCLWSMRGDDRNNSVISNISIIINSNNTRSIGNNSNTIDHLMTVDSTIPSIYKYFRHSDVHYPILYLYINWAYSIVCNFSTISHYHITINAIINTYLLVTTNYKWFSKVSQEFWVFAYLWEQHSSQKQNSRLNNSGKMIL